MTREEGCNIICRLQNEPGFWLEFVQMPQARAIFTAKLRACNLPQESYDDLVMETYVHLYERGWKCLADMEEPEHLWSYFKMIVRSLFGVYKTGAGEYRARQALRNVLQESSSKGAVSIDDTFEDSDSPRVQLVDPTDIQTIVERAELQREFKSVLDLMRSCGRKGFPLYAEVIERIDLLDEDRLELALDLARRGMIKAPAKAAGNSWSEAEKIALRNNLNNNIYKRARQFFNEISLSRKFDCRV